MPSVDEVAVLSTCNRVEVYAAAHGPAGPVARAVADVLAVHGGFEAGQVLRLARIRVGGAAIEHLFMVACGLDSMAVGEDQIVAQIKDAARAAAAAGTAGPAITGLIDAALRASKRARTQTTISTHPLARAGLDLAARAWAGSPPATRLRGHRPRRAARSGRRPAELTAEATGEPAMRLSGLIAAPDGSAVIRAQATVRPATATRSAAS